MNRGKQMFDIAGKAALVVALALTAGCSSFGRSKTGALIQQADGRPTPGVEEYVWEEPMIDVVTVPPGLDPEGVYWRPAHQEIVEIRQGRWKRAAE